MSQTKGEYLGYLAAVHKLIGETPVRSDELDRLKNDIEDTELLVPVIGAFSAGKSSLLNAFLGEEILGVGLTPVTELATELRYNNEPHLLAMRPDGSSERLDTNALATLKARASEFTHLQLYLNNPRLKALPSLVLVDMPGFGSSLANHEKAIAYYLPRGVHFIVVTSIEDGNLTQSMMRQLDDLQTYGRNFSFLLNKVNLRSDDEVQKVADLIDEQIKANFPDAPPLVRINSDGAARLPEILARLDPEQIVRQVFEERLKDLTHWLISQVNLALSSLKKKQTENEFALGELAKGIRQVERKRDGILADLGNQQVGRTVELCVTEAGRELENARDELVNAILSRQPEAFQRIVSEVIRSTMSRTIKDQMDGFSRGVVADFAQELGDLGKAMGTFSNDEKWVENLSEKINRSLQKTGETLGNWSGSLAERNTRQVERLKTEGKWQEGQKVPQATYQGLATVLAVTSSVVHPLLELAIIFLPSILASFKQSRERDQLRQKVLHEIIPGLQRQLRAELPPLLGQQLNALVTQVGEEFGREIGERQRIIDELVSSQQQGDELSEQQVSSLTLARDELQRLAKKVLYSEAQQ